LPTNRFQAQINLRVAEDHTFTSDHDRLFESTFNSSAAFDAVKFRPRCSLAFCHCIGHEFRCWIHQDCKAEGGLGENGDVACVGLFEDGTANVGELPNSRNGYISDLTKATDEF
jgi:hypothetical protein